jgi:hypothetical protein
MHGVLSTVNVFKKKAAPQVQISRTAGTAARAGLTA